MFNLASILAIALAVFSIGKPVCLRFVDEADFDRRRNIWLLLTAAGFLSPNIWIFTLAAAPILLWAGGRDTNPIALYLMLLHVIPPFGVPIPTVIINQLFELNMYRLLAFALLVPAAWRLRKERAGTGREGSLRTIDRLLLAYCGFVLVSVMPFESVTNTLRRVFLLCVDVLLIYYVVSRVCADRRRFTEAMASFVLVCAIAAPMAAIESLRGTQFYSVIGYKWNIDYLEFAKLLRGETLRAQVSAGHALALGYLIAMAIGFFLYLASHLNAKRLSLIISFWLVIGLVATLSRGPWLVAVTAFLTFMAIGPRGSVRLVKGLVAFGLVAGLVLASPVGDQLLDILPFVGSVDEQNVAYRQRLAEVSWSLIQENPLFGDPFFLRNMEEMRQGQGIIDLVNVYAAVALQSGLVGLALFLGPFAVGIWRAFGLARRAATELPDVASLGASLIACMVGTLLMFATGSFGTGVQVMFYVLIGLAAAFPLVAETCVSANSRESGKSGRLETRGGRAQNALVSAAPAADDVLNRAGDRISEVGEADGRYLRKQLREGI